MNRRAYPYRCAEGHRHSSARSAERCYYCVKVKYGLNKRGDIFAAGQYHLPDNLNPLMKKLFTEAYKQRITFKDLGRRVGITRQAIVKWKNRSQPSLGNYEACMNALGFKIILRPITGPGDD